MSKLTNNLKGRERFVNRLQEKVAIVTGGAHGIGAVLVLISSVQAIQGFKGAAAYATSKGGQLSLLRQLASDRAPAIRVNAILPGTIRSYPESITPEAEKQIGSWPRMKRRLSPGMAW